MQMINALVKTTHKNNFIYKRLKHTFILEVRQVFVVAITLTPARCICVCNFWPQLQILRGQLTPHPPLTRLFRAPGFVTLAVDLHTSILIIWRTCDRNL